METRKITMNNLAKEEEDNIRKLFEDPEKAKELWLTILFMMFNQEDTKEILNNLTKEDSTDV